MLHKDNLSSNYITYLRIERFAMNYKLERASKEDVVAYFKIFHNRKHRTSDIVDIKQES